MFHCFKVIIDKPLTIDDNEGLVPFPHSNFKQVELPKELDILIKTIDNNFSKVKDKLLFNKKTHYYYIVIDNYKLNVLCEHQYRFLNKELYAEIIRDCYIKGRCKYCGVDMFVIDSDYGKSYEVYEYIHKFIFAINEKAKNNNLFDIIYGLVGSIIDLIKEESTDKNKTICLIILIKLYLLTKTDINYYASRINALKQVLQKMLIANNLETQQIEIEKYVEDNKDFIEFFKQYVSMFNTFDTTTVPKPSKETINIPTIWNKTFIMVQQQQQSLSLNLNFKSILSLLSIYTISDLNNNSHNNNPIINFFKTNYRYYCPNHIIHKFKNGICIYCDLDLTGKNIDTIIENNKLNILIGKETDYNVPKSDITVKLSEDEEIIANINQLDENLYTFPLKIEDLNANERQQVVNVINIILNLSNIKLINHEDANLIKRTILYITINYPSSDLFSLINYHIYKESLSIIQLSKIIKS
jgi:hypothetical protein